MRYWGKTTHTMFLRSFLRIPIYSFFSLLTHELTTTTTTTTNNNNRVGEWSFVEQLLVLTEKSTLLNPEVTLSVVYLKKKMENLRGQCHFLERRQFEKVNYIFHKEIK